MSALEDLGWQQSGACLGTDPDVFFPEAMSSVPGKRKRSTKSREEIDQEARAKSICATCSVRPLCQGYADALRIPEGVWGGEAGDERRKRWRIEKRRRLS